MSLVLQVNIKVKPENLGSFMNQVQENANAVPLLASRERHFWTKA